MLAFPARKGFNPRMLRALRPIAAITCALGLLAAAAPARADVEVRNARVSDENGYTRAVFELSIAGEYKIFTLSDPARVVIDVERGRLGPNFKSPAGAGLVKGIRSGAPQPGNLRVVLDLASDAKPRSFMLTPGQRAGHRLVVDLTPPKSKPVKTVETVAAGVPRDVVIAIDAGHGGQDPGAIGPRGTHEKDVTLQIARRLATAIDATPGMQAVLIRDDDVFLPLKRRYEKARDAKADLLISLHADAIASGRAAGSSVYMLSTRGASSEAARWLADRENASDLVGGVSLADKDDTLAAVLLDLSQGATLGASDAAASHVLLALSRFGRVHKQEVQRANFVVLRSPDVPSILVETAFISNAEEEKRLRDPRHQSNLAQAITEGVSNYFYAAPPPGTFIAQNPRRAREHIVARGETLALIAQRHGVSLASLRRANGIRGDLVKPGDVLRIPGTG
jgi:N-acetylmuramoyl-L-alanine amidase